MYLLKSASFHLRRPFENEFISNSNFLIRSLLFNAFFSEGLKTLAGPFIVTTANSSTDYEVGQYVEVTWDVANTTAAPVSCGTVIVPGALL